jgi:hypothetical protein
MHLTRLVETEARPMRRSTASGGHVDIRSVGRISGYIRIVAGSMFARFPVDRKAASTSLVV